MCEKHFTVRYNATCLCALPDRVRVVPYHCRLYKASGLVCPEDMQTRVYVGCRGVDVPPCRDHEDEDGEYTYESYRHVSYRSSRRSRHRGHRSRREGGYSSSRGYPYWWWVFY